MKTTRLPPRMRERFSTRLRRLRAAPLFGRIVQEGAVFLAAIPLAALRLGDAPLPVAAAAVLSVAFFPHAAFAALGALAGYVLCWPWAEALEPVALTVLCFAGAGLFHELLQRSRWLAPLMSLSLCAVLGAVMLLDEGLHVAALVRFAVCLPLAALTPPLFRLALEGREATGRRLAALVLLIGLAMLAPPLGLYAAAGLACAVAVASAETDILPTLLGGIGLDLTGGLPIPATAAMAGAALLCRLLPRRAPPVLRAVSFPVVLLSWQLLHGQFSFGFCAACILGSAAGLLLPPLRLFAPVREEKAADPAEPMRSVARVFALLHRELSDPLPAADSAGIGEVYDDAADRVCRLCVRNRICWQQQAEQTYRILCAAAAPMMQRGSAVREDFPPEFCENCRHMEGFLTAVNQGIDAQRSRRQLHSRLQEGRRVLASQYLFLSRFLGRLADEGRMPPTRAAFEPEFFVGAACRPGSALSGDRGASFRDRWNHFFVLLCDGMGSGEEAARESGRAVHALVGLLQAGVAPDSALEILNGFYVLQEQSAFSTVDLLCADLAEGGATLYKWGAAPSYLKHGETVEKIGTVSPPPGLCAGSEHTAEQQRLSLKDGETLIMVSDGAFGEVTERRAAKFRGESLRALAEELVAGLRAGSEDDLTVAVLRLKSVA